MNQTEKLKKLEREKREWEKRDKQERIVEEKRSRIRKLQAESRERKYGKYVRGAKAGWGGVKRTFSAVGSGFESVASISPANKRRVRSKRTRRIRRTRYPVSYGGGGGYRLSDSLFG